MTYNTGMANTASISLACPEMQIAYVDSGHKRTAAEPMRATIFLPGETDPLIIPAVTIPPTTVVKQRFWRWLVDACVGQGETPEATLIVRLPPELTVWSWPDLTMVAVSIDAPTTLLLADGTRWEGSVTFPVCRISGLLQSTQIAEAITAQGRVTQTGVTP